MCRKGHKKVREVNKIDWIFCVATSHFVFSSENVTNYFKGLFDYWFYVLRKLPYFFKRSNYLNQNNNWCQTLYEKIKNNIAIRKLINGAMCSSTQAEWSRRGSCAHAQLTHVHPSTHTPKHYTSAANDSILLHGKNGSYPAFQLAIWICWTEYYTEYFTPQNLIHKSCGNEFMLYKQIL